MLGGQLRFYTRVHLSCTDRLIAVGGLKYMYLPYKQTLRSFGCCLSFLLPFFPPFVSSMLLALQSQSACWSSDRPAQVSCTGTHKKKAIQSSYEAVCITKAPHRFPPLRYCCLESTSKNSFAHLSHTHTPSSTCELLSHENEVANILGRKQQQRILLIEGSSCAAKNNGAAQCHSTETPAIA